MNGVTTFKDDRDQKVYRITKIGTQVWMAQNLNFGTRIDGVVPQRDDATSSRGLVGADANVERPAATKLDAKLAFDGLLARRRPRAAHEVELDEGRLGVATRRRRLRPTAGRMRQHEAEGG